MIKEKMMKGDRYLQISSEACRVNARMTRTRFADKDGRSCGYSGSLGDWRSGTGAGTT